MEGTVGNGKQERKESNRGNGKIGENRGEMENQMDGMNKMDVMEEIGRNGRWNDWWCKWSCLCRCRCWWQWWWCSVWWLAGMKPPKFGGPVLKSETDETVAQRKDCLSSYFELTR